MFTGARVSRGIMAMLLATWLGGCVSYGPRSMAVDQLDYATSLGDSWKNQMLANVVKIRYVDMPVFMDVGQIVSGYTLEASVNGNISFGLPPGGDAAQNLGASGKFTDRPTITYSPKIGDDYLRSLIEPVEPRGLLGLVAAGYASDLLFTWGVESINGVPNAMALLSEGPRGNRDMQLYRELVRLIGELQRSNHVSFEVRHDETRGTDVVLSFRDDAIDEGTLAKIRRVREILNLDFDRSDFSVRYGVVSTSSDVLAIRTRSILQILTALSTHIDVPADRAEGSRPGLPAVPASERPFRVRFGDAAPENAYARFYYQGYWYWIDNADIASKRVFTLMMFITTLTNRSGRANEPVLTIPTG
jgi:hypothetical protein